MPSPRRAISALLLLPACIHALTLDCSQIVIDGTKFNLEKLGGQKTVHFEQWKSLPPTNTTTTFALDICKPLTDKDAKKNEKCPSGTRVCAKRWEYREKEKPYLESVITIAGEFSTSDGSNRALEPKFTRLKGSAGNSEDKEGLIMELHGGKFPDDKSGTRQKAVIEFLCDKKVSGNEGFDGNSKTPASRIATPAAEPTSMQKRADDDNDPDVPDMDKGQSLRFMSYRTENEFDVLRLQWKSKFACEDAAQNGNDKTGGWGFFTWFLIIVFLLVASYIIFGSWLNYNRYGARGWDLIPHGDTIRDIPYIVKDWGNNVADKLKGQNSRGGYSAV